LLAAICLAWLSACHIHHHGHGPHHVIGHHAPGHFPPGHAKRH
jgi:hypothetical protein